MSMSEGVAPKSSKSSFVRGFGHKNSPLSKNCKRFLSRLAEFCIGISIPLKTFTIFLQSFTGIIKYCLFPKILYDVSLLLLRRTKYISYYLKSNVI
jgi:hypothetical protein